MQYHTFHQVTTFELQTYSFKPLNFKLQVGLKPLANMFSWDQKRPTQGTHETQSHRP